MVIDSWTIPAIESCSAEDDTDRNSSYALSGVTAKAFQHRPPRKQGEKILEDLVDSDRNYATMFERSHE